MFPAIGGALLKGGEWWAKRRLGIQGRSGGKQPSGPQRYPLAQYGDAPGRGGGTFTGADDETGTGSDMGSDTDQAAARRPTIRRPTRGG